MSQPVIRPVRAPRSFSIGIKRNYTSTSPGDYGLNILKQIGLIGFYIDVPEGEQPVGLQGGSPFTCLFTACFKPHKIAPSISIRGSEMVTYTPIERLPSRENKPNKFIANIDSCSTLLMEICKFLNNHPQLYPQNVGEHVINKGNLRDFLSVLTDPSNVPNLPPDFLSLVTLFNIQYFLPNDISDLIFTTPTKKKVLVVEELENIMKINTTKVSQQQKALINTLEAILQSVQALRGSALRGSIEDYYYIQETLKDLFTLSYELPPNVRRYLSYRNYSISAVQTQINFASKPYTYFEDLVTHLVKNLTGQTSICINISNSGTTTSYLNIQYKHITDTNTPLKVINNGLLQEPNQDKGYIEIRCFFVPCYEDNPYSTLYRIHTQTRINNNDLELKTALKDCIRCATNLNVNSLNVVRYICGAYNDVAIKEESINTLSVTNKNNDVVLCKAPNKSGNFATKTYECWVQMMQLNQNSILKFHETSITNIIYNYESEHDFEECTQSAGGGKREYIIVLNSKKTRKVCRDKNNCKFINLNSERVYLKDIKGKYRYIR